MHSLMRASSMFFWRLLFLRFSSFAASKMDAFVITRGALMPSSSSLHKYSPLLVPQNSSYFFRFSSSHRCHQRNLRRMYASSDTPSPFLHSNVVKREQDSLLEAAKDDRGNTATSTSPEPVDFEGEKTTEVVKDQCPEASFIQELANTEQLTTVEAAKDDTIFNVGSCVPKLFNLEQESTTELAQETKTASTSSKSIAIVNMDVSLKGQRRKKKVIVRPKRLCSDQEDLMFMQEALLEANKGAKMEEVPVGAVLVHKKSIIARFHNQVETIGDPTAHAEMLCIRSAASQLGGWRLADVTMYVTLEPCPMCAGAILQARVGELVWGARNSLLGADGSWIKLFPESSTCDHEPKGADYLHPFHRTINVRRGVLAEESADVIQTFFQMRRLQTKCRAEDALLSGRSVPWPRSRGWFPPAFKKLNLLRRWFQF